MLELNSATKAKSVIAVSAVALLTLTAIASVRTVVIGGEVAGWDHSFHSTSA